MLSLKSIVNHLLRPLFALNLAGLAAGGAWLANIGQTQVIWIGIAMMFVSPMVISILLMPAGIFSHFIGVYHQVGNKRRERIMFVLSLVYIILFLTLWCTSLFNYVTQNVAVSALKPAMIWAATASMAPLLWWSSRDSSNVFIMMMVQATQIAVLVLAAAWLVHGPVSFWPLCAIFAAFLTVVATARGFYEKRKGEIA